jgi:hypothetical protein
VLNVIDVMLNFVILLRRFKQLINVQDIGPLENIFSGRKCESTGNGYGES